MSADQYVMDDPNIDIDERAIEFLGWCRDTQDAQVKWLMQDLNEGLDEIIKAGRARIDDHQINPKIRVEQVCDLLKRRYKNNKRKLFDFDPNDSDEKQKELKKKLKDDLNERHKQIEDGFLQLLLVQKKALIDMSPQARMIRVMMRHEDTLMVTRMNWFYALNAFLWVDLGQLYIALATDAEGTFLLEIKIVIVVTASVGVLTPFCTIHTLNSTQRAVQRLTKYFKTEHFIIGAYDSLSVKGWFDLNSWYFSPRIASPVIFAAAWWVVLVVALVNFTGHVLDK
eukprot:scaffold1336_cov174-Amphora_coffeaeformis.AAC.9